MNGRMRVEDPGEGGHGRIMDGRPGGGGKGGLGGSFYSLQERFLSIENH